MQGLGVTFRYQDPKEIYTEPVFRWSGRRWPMRYRGAPRLNVNPDTDETLCISCDLSRGWLARAPDCCHQRAQ